MHSSISKSVSVLVVAAVAVLGVDYASSAANGNANSTVIAPIRNIAHIYTATTAGGTGQVSFNVPIPSGGTYQASFTANFFPEGSPAAPESFSCYIIKDSGMLTQSTIVGTYTSGFYLGVNGIGTAKLTTSTILTAGCGQNDGSSWSWGTRPLQVTLTRLDGFTSAPLAAVATPLHQATGTTAVSAR